MRHLLLGALVGGLVLLTPYRAVAADTAPSLATAPPVGHLDDIPREPGDAFPTGPFAGGTE